MIKGSIVALITPFQRDGRIDFPVLKELVKWHLEQGTDGLVLCGTTGEGNSLEQEEKLLIFETAKQLAGGKMSLIASTGTGSTKESVFLTKEAKKLEMDACIAIVPYYVRPSPEGCFEHFKHIASIGLPTILYHHPGRTGTRLSCGDLERIFTLPEMIGIKDAAGDLNFSMDLAGKIPHFSGDDTLALPQFSIGFAGSISIMGNIFPKEWKAFVDLALDGKFLDARSAFFSLHRYCKAMVLESNPQCVKYALSLLKRCQPHLRLPLCLPKKENRVIIEELFHARLLDELSDQSCPASLVRSS